MLAGDEWQFYDNNGGLGTGVKVDTSWHHHCLVYDGNFLTYYIDGDRVAIAAKSLNTASGPLVFGGCFGSDSSFDGEIDEFALFDRALGTPEVQRLYQLGLDGISLAAISLDANLPSGGNRVGSSPPVNYPRNNPPIVIRNDQRPSAVEPPKTERRKVFVFSGNSAIVTPVQRSLPSTVEAWIWFSQPSETADMFVFGSDDTKQSNGGLGVRINKNGYLGGRRSHVDKKMRDFGADKNLPIRKMDTYSSNFYSQQNLFFC